MIDVRRLRVLRAVVESGSISAAAAQLAYTPSAVSQQIAALERETGTVLFERAGRGLRATEAARLLCEHAVTVMAAIENAEEALSALRAGKIGRIRVGAFATAGAALVPGALAAFQRAHPNVLIDLATVEADDAIAGLRNGTIDVVVTIRHADGTVPESEDLVFEHLLDDPFRVVLARTHPLAGAARVDLASLADERWIAISSSPGYCQAVVDQACARAGYRPRYALDAEDYGTAQGFVAAGLGVALVPLLALGAVHSGVTVVRLEQDEPVREVYLATRPAARDFAAVQSMLACLREAAANTANTDERV